MLTIQEIISSFPFYDAEIICGWKGKERFILDAVDTPEQLEKPSLLILPKSISMILQLGDYLSLSNVQGVVLFGTEDISISSTIIEACDTYNKPILLLKNHNPLSIKKGITDLQQLKTMGFYHYVWERSTHYWLQLIQETGLDRLLQRLHLFIGDDIFLLNEQFYLQSINGETSPQGQWRELMSRYYQERKTKAETLFIFENGDNNDLLFLMRSGEQNYGFILIKEKPGMMMNVTIEQVTHAIPAIISFLKKEEAVLQAHQSYKKQFLNNLLYNNIESNESLIQQGKQWNWDFTKPAQLMVMRINPKAEFTNEKIEMNAITGEIRSIVQANFHQVITYENQGMIVLIIFGLFENTGGARKERMVSLAQKLQLEIQQAHPKSDCLIGIGRQYPTNMELFRSFYEAKVALELGKYQSKHSPVLHFEDIGIVRLLANIHNDILHDYYQETLGELIQLDKNNDDFYVETLEAFYNNNGDINQTADELFVHPNTLRKRIKKLESILHADFNQFDDILKISVALKIMKMLK
jgi:sugar diacid utilization regulator